MEAEEGDTYPEIRSFPQLLPAARLRSHSDTSGFRSRVLYRLRGARSGRSDPHLKDTEYLGPKNKKRGEKKEKKGQTVK